MDKITETMNSRITDAMNKLDAEIQAEHRYVAVLQAKINGMELAYRFLSTALEDDKPKDKIPDGPLKRGMWWSGTSLRDAMRKSGIDEETINKIIVMPRADPSYVTPDPLMQSNGMNGKAVSKAARACE